MLAQCQCGRAFFYKVYTGIYYWYEKLHRPLQPGHFTSSLHFTLFDPSLTRGPPGSDLEKPASSQTCMRCRCPRSMERPPARNSRPRRRAPRCSQNHHSPRRRCPGGCPRAHCAPEGLGLGAVLILLPAGPDRFAMPESQTQPNKLMAINTSSKRVKTRSRGDERMR